MMLVFQEDGLIRCLMLLWLGFLFPLYGQLEREGFPISEIRYEGLRLVSEAICRSEAGLQAGKTYKERDLLLAQRRLARLPFVLEVEPRLEKGGEYGSYRLVFVIKETRTLLYSLNYLAQNNETQISAPSFVGEDLGVLANQLDDSDEGLDLGELALGARWFTGGHGLFYLTAKHQLGQGREKDRLPFDLGFTHYHLFGRRILLNLNLQYQPTFSQSSFDPLVASDFQRRTSRPLLPSISLNVPLGQVQWLSLASDYFEEENRFVYRSGRLSFMEKINDMRWKSSISWYRDTTDQLTLPSRGLRLEAGLDYIDLKTSFTTSFGQTPISPYKNRDEPETQIDNSPSPSDRSRFFAQLAWYRPLAQRTRFQLTTLARYNVKPNNNTSQRNFDSLITTGIAQDLLTPAWLSMANLRLELSLGYRRGREFHLERSNRYVEGSAVFRNNWGLIRMALRYGDRQVDLLGDPNQGITFPGIRP